MNIYYSIQFMGKKYTGKQTINNKKISNSFANLEDHEDVSNVMEERTDYCDKVINNTSKHIYAEERDIDEDISEAKDNEWASVSKKQKNKKNVQNYNRQYNVDEYIPPKNDTNTEEYIDDGSDFKFNMKWYIWTHLSESGNWSIDSYKHIFTIDSMKTFWEFFGNLEKLDIIKHHFYIMRENSGPTWEHPSNRDGGICSIRLAKDKIIELVEQIAVLIINESFLDNNSEINGFSVSAKHMWGLIKIWNKNSDDDISHLLPQYMIRKYSLSPRYGSNKPEY